MSEAYRERIFAPATLEYSPRPIASPSPHPVPARVEQIGAERVLFGSDWPNPEGVREPLDFVQECDGLAPGPLRSPSI